MRNVIRINLGMSRLEYDPATSIDELNVTAKPGHNNS